MLFRTFQLKGKAKWYLIWKKAQGSCLKFDVRLTTEIFNELVVMARPDLKTFKFSKRKCYIRVTANILAKVNTLTWKQERLSWFSQKWIHWLESKNDYPDSVKNEYTDLKGRTIILIQFRLNLAYGQIGWRLFSQNNKTNAVALFGINL